MMDASSAGNRSEAVKKFRRVVAAEHRGTVAPAAPAFWVAGAIKSVGQERGCPSRSSFASPQPLDFSHVSLKVGNAAAGTAALLPRGNSTGPTLLIAPQGAEARDSSYCS